MNRKPYNYVQAVASSAVIDADAERYIKRVLRKLVRESLLCTARPKADGKHYEVHKAWANRIARRMVP